MLGIPSELRVAIMESTGMDLLGPDEKLPAKWSSFLVILQVEFSSTKISRISENAFCHLFHTYAVHIALYCEYVIVQTQ